jgi:hypothetical protein
MISKIGIEILKESLMNNEYLTYIDLSGKNENNSKIII